MNVVVVGCGRVGAALAWQLFQHGHTVTVADQSADAFANLHPEFRGRTVIGDVLSQDVLNRTGLEAADAVAVVTSHDAVNAVLAHVARTVFGVTNVVVRNYDPKRRPLHEVFGLQVVSSTSWGVERVRELLERPGMQSVLTAGHGETRVYELTVTDALADRRLVELLPAGEAIAVSVTRGGRAQLPPAEFTVARGDVLLVSATSAGAARLQELVAPEQEV